MEIDKTTLSDLVIFDRDDEFSVLQKIDFTKTGQGHAQLRKNLRSPLNSIEEIIEVQEALKFIAAHEGDWPKQISNGSLMVAERFYDAQIDSFPLKPSVLAALSYRVLHRYDYSLVKYSLKHTVDVISAMGVFQTWLEQSPPPVLRKELDRIRELLSGRDIAFLTRITNTDSLTPQATLEAAAAILYRFKGKLFDLIGIYAKLDAWRSMAIAQTKLGLVMPEFVSSTRAVLEAEGLYHVMLETPVPYDLHLDREKNFLFLTGANMAGKSTFIKACGIAVYLAHTGMGVPARKMRLSFFDGILSNINVIDNIAKGESYFYNEVKRIKSTISKISDGRKWLILIDELFKGTNVEDAMKCSTAVIGGLQRIPGSVFILSTHLYEIGDSLKQFPNISFKFFETAVDGQRLQFSYRLKDGISADRLGYLILEREGVVRMLDAL